METETIQAENICFKLFRRKGMQAGETRIEYFLELVYTLNGNVSSGNIFSYTLGISSESYGLLKNGKPVTPTVHLDKDNLEANLRSKIEWEARDIICRHNSQVFGAEPLKLIYDFD